MPLRGRTVESMNFGMIATGNHCDFNALRAAPRSLHNVGKLPDFCVIARSAATWQSPGRIHRNAQQKQTWYREIPTGLTALGMTENVGAEQCPAHNRQDFDCPSPTGRQGDGKRKAPCLSTWGVLHCLDYLAYSTALVSRMTLTLIWPGYSSSASIFLAMSRASRIMLSSVTTSGLTMMRTSRPAWMA